MQLWRGTGAVPEDLGGTVVTIGTFDGVHRGHQAVLRRTVEAARERGLVSVAVSFDPHPATVHRPEQRLALITALPDRLERLAETGLDAVLLLEYTLDFARTGAEEFVRRYFAGLLHARHVVVGEDSRFGWQNTGDVALLRRLGPELGFTVDVVADLTSGGRRWSSTWVRELLAAGDVRGAAEVLGRNHRLRGVVVHGHRRGRELGYPTANLAPHDLAVVPADGVYAGWLLRPARGERLPAAISIGSNPTFHDGVARTVEAHVLGRDDLDLYDEEVVVELVEHLRPMVAFAGVPDLVAQMADDVARAAAVLGVDGASVPAAGSGSAESRR